MSGLDTLFSAASSIGQKVDSLNITNTIQTGISGVSSALQNAAGSLPSLNILSRFEQNDLQKVSSPKGTQTPTEARNSRTAFGGALSFPSELKYFTKFAFYEYDKKVVNGPTKDIPTKTIILPMPNDLHETFGVEYETPALGPVFGAVSNSLINAVRSGGSSLSVPSGSDIVSTAATAGAATGINMLKKGSPALAAGAQMAMGVAPNPNIAVLFSNIGLRTHSFSYKFAPTSIKELATLKQIITELKKRMLPGLANDGTMLFTFPDVCDIEFGPTKNTPYMIKRCVMESMNVNYTPMGSPAFFKTGDPVMVEIQMSFKEMSPFTRKDMGMNESIQPRPTPSGPASSYQQPVIAPASTQPPAVQTMAKAFSGGVGGDLPL